MPNQTADGPTHMARDEALLASVDEEPLGAVLRVYKWWPATLSLGYFQKLEWARRDRRWHEVPIVRRPSGGGAIFHDQELTFALILPRAFGVASNPVALYQAVHGHLARGLRSLGFPAERRGGGAIEHSERRPFLCFQDSDPEDIVVRGHKVIGSAQRRRPRAVLIHGSVLLATSQRVPEVLGLDHLGAAPHQVAMFMGAWLEELPEALGLTSQPSVLTDDERQHASFLRENRYNAPEWLNRR